MTFYPIKRGYRIQTANNTRFWRKRDVHSCTQLPFVWDEHANSSEWTPTWPIPEFVRHRVWKTRPLRNPLYADLISDIPIS